jgi:UDP-2,3-diacylglucosamine hydrolase
VLPSPCFIIADAHLGFGPPAAERRMLDFLHWLPGHAASLVINGDLFEFWFEWRHVVPRRAVRTLAALAEVRERGIPVVMLAGNHDCWGGDVLREDYGIDFRTDALTGPVAGWTARVEHGDGVREVEDRKYRRLRTVLRHPWAIRAFRLLHPDLGSRLAYGSSHASRSYGAHDEGAGMREVAARVLGATPGLELLVYGHSHVAALERMPGGGVFANPGPWLDAPTYLDVRPGRIALKRFDGSAEGANLHVLDRIPEEPLPEREELPRIV